VVQGTTLESCSVMSS